LAEQIGVTAEFSFGRHMMTLIRCVEKSHCTVGVELAHKVVKTINGAARVGGPFFWLAAGRQAAQVLASAPTWLGSSSRLLLRVWRVQEKDPTTLPLFFG